MKILENNYKEETRNMYCTYCNSFLEVSDKDIKDEMQQVKRWESVKCYYYVCPCCERKNFINSDNILVNIRYGNE